MKTSEKAYKENHKARAQNVDSQLTRRNFLKLFGAGAALGSGALLSSTPALGSNTTMTRLKELSYQSNPDELYWRMIREQFCLKDELIHMNTGTIGNMSKLVRDNLFANLQLIAEDPYPTIYDFDLADAHAKAKDFMGSPENPVSEDEIIITGCTTEGMSFVAMGLDLQAGDEVLTTTHEHDGGICCWRILKDRRGITLTEIPFYSAYEDKDEIVEAFENAITSNTKVMSFCHINYTSGLKMPVKELCQLAADHDIISVVDGAHAIGMLNLDLKDLGCDFYACSPQKWLCAPPGVGVLYASSDKQHLIWPTITEVYGVGNLQFQLEWRGQKSSPLLSCITEAMEFQETIGQDTIESRVMALSAYAKARLMEIPGVRLHSSTDPEQSSGLTFFYVKNQRLNHADLSEKLRQDYNILIRTIKVKHFVGDPWTRGLRISTHIYNNYDQIDFFARAIEENLDMM